MEVHSKKVFITGIGGFTGTQIAQFLKNKGWTITGLGSVVGNSDYTCISTDLSNKDEITDFLSVQKPNYILHFAGISFVGHPNPIDFYQVNTIGTQLLLDAVLAASIKVEKIILASSATIYGNQDNFILSEEMTPNPVNHYGMSKLAMEYIASTYFDRLPIIITRPFNYTGTGHSLNFLIPKIISHFKEKKEKIALGNLHTLREYNDVDWVCDVYMKLLESSSKSEIVNLCSGKTHSIEEILLIASEISNHNIDIEVNPQFVRTNEIHELKGSGQKLYSMIDQDELPENDIYQLIKKMLND